jgi:glycosidase
MTPQKELKNEKVVIYQMMTRLFGNTKTSNIKYGTREENGVGKFNDISVKALEGIKELGITHIWYTGVLEHAIIADYSEYGIDIDDADVVKGRAGSPYAIKDYYDVNPDLAENIPNRLNEFKQAGITHP